MFGSRPRPKHMSKNRTLINADRLRVRALAFRWASAVSRSVRRTYLPWRHFAHQRVQRRRVGRDGPAEVGSAAQARDERTDVIGQQQRAAASGYVSASRCQQVATPSCTLDLRASSAEVPIG
jgi:hypothetical protein